MNDTRKKVVSIIQEKTGLDDVYARDLEIGIYNWSIKYSDSNKIVKNWNNSRFACVYKDKARSVIANIDKSSYLKNVRLIDRLKEHEFMPHDIPFMLPENVFPEVWQQILEATSG